MIARSYAVAAFSSACPRQMRDLAALLDDLTATSASRENACKNRHSATATFLLPQITRGPAPEGLFADR